jgi:hypothetical protein
MTDFTDEQKKIIAKIVAVHNYQLLDNMGFEFHKNEIEKMYKGFLNDINIGCIENWINNYNLLKKDN